MIPGLYDLKYTYLATKDSTALRLFLASFNKFCFPQEARIILGKLKCSRQEESANTAARTIPGQLPLLPDPGRSSKFWLPGAMPH